MTTDPADVTASSKPSRRTFLTSAALTGVAVGAGTWVSSSAEASTAPIVNQRPASCGLELEGARAGGLQSVSGGGVVAGVYGKSAKGVRRKQPIDIRLEDITVSTGIGMSKAFYQNVTEMVRGSGGLRHGRVTARDGTGAVIRVRRFFQAQLSEVAFSTLDASSDQAALMSVTFTPGGLYANPAAGPKQPTPSTATWLQNGFKLQINGVDCSRVSRIEPIVIKAPKPKDLPGVTKEPPQPKAMEYPNLVITMAESHASSLYKWSDSLLLDLKPDERSGQLEFLSTTGGVLFTLKFSHLGVFKIEPSTVSASSDVPPTVTASIYCEQMTFSHTVAAVG